MKAIIKARSLRNYDFPFRTVATVLLVASVLAGSASPAGEKRKPGLYWTIETDKGKISCSLYEADAPVTVRTMVGLALGKISYLHPETKQTVQKK